jgi:predicted unusual protein kinase regulating ubiquinone biosynthesis (AarF/ABC1/UbiB family)
LVLRDGRVGFIDFGIVGRISPGVWGAVQIFFQATASRDYLLMVGLDTIFYLVILQSKHGLDDDSQYGPRVTNLAPGSANPI